MVFADQLEQADATTYRSPGAHATESVGRQDGDPTIVYSRALSVHRATSDGRWNGELL